MWPVKGIFWSTMNPCLGCFLRAVIPRGRNRFSMLDFMQMRYAIQLRLDEVRPFVASYRIAMESRWVCGGLNVALTRWLFVIYNHCIRSPNPDRETEANLESSLNRPRFLFYGMSSVFEALSKELIPKNEFQGAPQTDNRLTELTADRKQTDNILRVSVYP